MKRSRVKRPMSALDYSQFARGVYELHGDRCWACRTDVSGRWKCAQRSDGRIDAHHVLSQGLLKRELTGDTLTAALKDSRLGVPLGRYHHDMVEHSMVRIDVPDECWRAADDYGLTWALLRLEERAA